MAEVKFQFTVTGMKRETVNKLVTLQCSNAYAAF